MKLRKELSEKQYKKLNPVISILGLDKEFVAPEKKKTLKRLFKYSPIADVEEYVRRQILKSQKR